MITANEFDLVFDCQQVFKQLMQAMANPGKVFSIGQNSAKIHQPAGSLLAIAMTLVDSRCRFSVAGDDELAQAMHEVTLGVPTGVEEADYIFVPQAQDMDSARPAILERAKKGTLAEPHKSAAIFIQLDSLEGGPEALLQGPGVDGSIAIRLPQAGQRWIEERQQMELEFPQGLELYFVTPDGELMGVPRKIRMGGCV